MSLAIVGCGGQPTIDTARLPTPVNPIVHTMPTDGLQVTAADALGKIGTPAVPSLSAALADSDPVVRVQACRALAYMGAKAKDAVPALTRALSDADETVRQQAAIALGQIGEDAGAAVPELMRMMQGGTASQPAGR